MEFKESIKVEKLKSTHRRIYTAIEIKATLEQVWSVLTDTSSYKDWAGFMVAIKGEIVHGNTIVAVFQLNPKKNKLNKIRHKISVVDGHAFSWSEKGPGGITDNHHFMLEVTSNKGITRFVQVDELKGGITWLVGGKLSKLYAEGYQLFNRKLKLEVERRFLK